MDAEDKKLATAVALMDGQMAFLKEGEGRTVLHEDGRDWNPNGEDVMVTPHIRRCLRDGDLVKAKRAAPPKEPAKEPAGGTGAAPPEPPAKPAEPADPPAEPDEPEPDAKPRRSRKRS